MKDEEIMFARLFAPIKAKIQDKNRYITELEKENAELSQMIDVSFMSFLPRSQEMVACSQCEYDDFGYCRIDKRDNVDYKHCKKCYREALLKRAELKKRVEK